MPVSFNVSEILQFAIRIEENGEEFYRLMAQKLKKLELRETFTYLADEEVRHRHIFETMASRIVTYEPPESYTEEYFAYLKAYADGYIFTKEKKGKLMARKVKTAKEALDFALGAEVDSILYYLEAKNLVSDDQKGIIDKIIEEERRHYLKLVALRKK